MSKTKQKSSSGSSRIEKTKKKRPGIHAKSKTSKLKNSKNYTKKKSVGQGKRR